MIDIVIPTYNEEKYVGSILNNFKNNLSIPHKIIVTDDRSKDKTREIAKQYTDTVIENPNEHSTIGGNRNLGASQGTAEFIVFFDADAVILNPNDFLQHALSRFENDKNIVGITGAFRVVKSSETFTDRVVYTIFNFVHYLKNNVFKTGEAPGKFQMVRRSAFEKIHGYDETLVSREDADLFQRLARLCGRTVYDGYLKIYHSGRRARKYGWPKLLFIWFRDTISVAWRGKAVSKSWEAVR